MVLAPLFSKIGKNGRSKLRDGFSNCVTTVYVTCVRNNSSSGISNESIANVLVEKWAPQVVRILSKYGLSDFSPIFEIRHEIFGYINIFK